MKVKTIPEINMTDNPLDNIIKMAPYLDEGSQRTVFGMMLERKLDKEATILYSNEKESEVRKK